MPFGSLETEKGVALYKETEEFIYTEEDNIDEILETVGTDQFSSISQSYMSQY